MLRGLHFSPSSYSDREKGFEAALVARTRTERHEDRDKSGNGDGQITNQHKIFCSQHLYSFVTKFWARKSGNEDASLVQHFTNKLFNFLMGHYRKQFLGQSRFASRASKIGFFFKAKSSGLNSSFTRFESPRGNDKDGDMEHR